MKAMFRQLPFLKLWIALALPAAVWAQGTPTLTKAFGAATIPLNGSTSLTFTIAIPEGDGGMDAGVSFTDPLPAGLVIATPNGLTGPCGSETAVAVAGTSLVSLTGSTVVVGCTFSINVTGTSIGVKNNITSTITTSGGWDPGAAATASLTVLGPPTVLKAFGAASIPLNGSTSLSFTITNPNLTVGLTGVAVNDTLPSGLIVATPTGLTGSCGGGSVTATAGSGTISLSGGTIAANAACTFSVNVTGTSVGAKNNTTGTVSSAEGGTGGTASASTAVVAPAGIVKAFGAPSIPLNGTTTLTFTITNPSASATLTGVAVTDNLPSGLTVAAPNGLTGSCGGGSVVAAPGSGSVSLSGATLAANAACTFAVNVTGTSMGVKNNVTGAVTSTEGGIGGTAAATLNVTTGISAAPALSWPALGTLALLIAGLGWTLARKSQAQSQA